MMRDPPGMRYPWGYWSCKEGVESINDSSTMRMLKLDVHKRSVSCMHDVTSGIDASVFIVIEGFSETPSRGKLSISFWTPGSRGVSRPRIPLRSGGTKGKRKSGVSSCFAF